MPSAASIIEMWVGIARGRAGEVIEASGWSPDSPDQYCRRCGSSVGPGEETTDGCASCRGARTAIDRFIRLGPYTEPLRGWIMDAKYDRWSEMASALGRRLGEALRESCPIDVARTIVVPIPMPWQRRMYRGIDHAAVIAHAAARVMRCEVHRVLAKANGPLQTALTATARQQRRKGWMRVRRRPGGWPLSASTIILVDDVRTTGTTLRTAARLVRTLEAARVVAGVIAVSDEKGRRAADAGRSSDA